jgi:NADH:ubiquinone oxidoreductase subunit E
MPQHTVKVCMGSSCFARGNLENLNFLETYIKENNLDTQVELVGALCSEQCSTGPNIYIDEVLYSEIDEEKLKEILPNVLK